MALRARRAGLSDLPDVGNGRRPPQGGGETVVTFGPRLQFCTVAFFCLKVLLSFNFSFGFAQIAFEGIDIFL